MEQTEEIEEIKQDSQKSDMLNGPMGKKLILFALPIAASSILQQLFNSADVAVAGRFAESGALAAVGSNSVLVGLFINIFVGLSVGTNVIISQYIGQQRNKDVGKVVHTSMLFSVICGIAVMILGLIISKPLLIITHAPEDVLDRAVVYLRIYFLGMPFIIPYNFGSAILRSVGDTKRPMYCLIASGILNIILNLIFVIAMRLGVAGVAIATVISNILSASVIFIILLREKGIIKLEIKNMKLYGKILLDIVKIGAPAALQSAVFSLSNICLQTAINDFGSSATGGMTAALNFEYFGFYIISALNQSAITFVAQNYGAGKYGRCKKILRICLLDSVIGTALLCAFFVIFKEFLIRIYTVDPNEIEFARLRMTYVLPFLFLASSYEITGSALRGMGRSVIPALLTVVGSVVFRLIWINLIFPVWNSFAGLIIVYPVSWVLTGTMVVSYYFLVRKHVYSNF